MVPAVVLGVTLAGCSDLYFDRRESIVFHAGDAPASNVIAQTIDPWPPAATNRRIPLNGQRAQKAIERYRTNKTTPLNPIGTSSAKFTPAGGDQGGAAPSGPPSP